MPKPRETLSNQPSWENWGLAVRGCLSPKGEQTPNSIIQFPTSLQAHKKRPITKIQKSSSHLFARIPDAGDNRGIDIMYIPTGGEDYV
jgi:hypothetical protein